MEEPDLSLSREDDNSQGPATAEKLACHRCRQRKVKTTYIARGPRVHDYQWCLICRPREMRPSEPMSSVYQGWDTVFIRSASQA
ncbi:hypothetical protein BDW71DRAFT_67141 [Aspergillus fruticulosus]